MTRHTECLRFEDWSARPPCKVYPLCPCYGDVPFYMSLDMPCVKWVCEDGIFSGDYSYEEDYAYYDEGKEEVRLHFRKFVLQELF